jgi:hypothetical protein
MRFFLFPTAMVRPLSSLAKFLFVIWSTPFPPEVLRRSSGIVFLSEFQKLYKFPECDFASRKGDLLRLKRAIPHPGGVRFTLAANLPFPCSVTTVGNDDMKFIAQQGRHD